MASRAVRILCLLTTTFALNACVTAPPTKPQAPSSGSQKDEPFGVDLGLLQRKLKLDRNVSDLGFEEKAFNPCEFDIPSPPSCQTQRLVVINFKLECRNTEGTAATVDSYTTQPIKNDDVRWRLGKIEGRTSTDHSGLGQIRALTIGSAKQNKLRLTLNGKFMILTAEEIRRVVVPADWCG